MRSSLKALPFGLALVVLLLAAATASAQTYTVTRTDDPIPGTCEPGDCSLREALTASNSSGAVNDVVALPASGSPYLQQYENLPFTITDETEVRGAGANQTVVRGDGESTIFSIGTGIKATIAGLTITNGTSAIQSNSELAVRDVSIEGNEWNGGTPGIITNGPLTVESSFLGFNRSVNVTPGAIFSNAPVTIVNSTIAHNSSTEGPGAIGANSSVSVVNSAVVSNRSGTAPAAAVGGTPLSVRNSVFADNRDATGLLSCASAGPLTSFGGNVSDDASCGTGATDKPNVNPLLGSLALHGGTTQVYDLLAGSPAIDAASQCPAVDQRGVARPQGAACDSGPYELVPPPRPPLPPVGDRELAMQLAKGRLLLNRKGRIRVRLTCPASEATPPCAGKVEVRAPLLRTLTGGIRDSRPVARYPTARFSIGAGETEAIGIKPPRSVVEILRDSPRPRKVRVIVTAADGAANPQVLKQRRKLFVQGPR